MPIGYIYSLEEARTELIKLDNSLRITADRITLRDNRIEGLEQENRDLKQEIIYLNERTDTLEAIHGDMFSLGLEQLKERRDRAYDSLDSPISDNAKNNINNEICKIETLISIRMKEVNSNGKDTQETS